MKRALFFIILSYSFGLQAQPTKTLNPRKLYKVVMKARNALIKKGVETILLYENGWIGPLDKPQDDACLCDNGHITSYLAWKENDTQFIRKFDCCRSYQTENLNADLFAGFFREETQITNESIKSQVFVYYYRFRHIHFYHKGEKYDFQLHDYDFTEKNRPWHKINQKLKIKQWCDEVEKEIEEIEKTTTFKPEKELVK